MLFEGGRGYVCDNYFYEKQIDFGSLFEITVICGNHMFGFYYVFSIEIN